MSTPEIASTTTAEDAGRAAPVLPDSHEIETIIRNRVYASMAVGLVPVPGVDLAALAAVQVEMLYRLANAYNIPFRKELGKKAIGVVLSVAVPSLFAPTFANFARYVPVIGQGLSLVSWPLTLGATTYGLGVAFRKHFESGGDFLSCDFSKIGEDVKSGYEKSVDTVKGWVKKDKGGEAEAPAAG
ncbi:MAG: DUF697 domain-containing protein [Rhodospirillaceae bacterium]|nr:DUF697 domain-containing protein [Rhodospirillaceae bacterium]